MFTTNTSKAQQTCCIVFVTGHNMFWVFWELFEPEQPLTSPRSDWVTGKRGRRNSVGSLDSTIEVSLVGWGKGRMMMWPPSMPHAAYHTHLNDCMCRCSCVRLNVLWRFISVIAEACVCDREIFEEPSLQLCLTVDTETGHHSKAHQLSDAAAVS